MEILRHWCAEPFELRPCCYRQEVGYKPKGLWFDINKDWKRWCEAESFGLERFTHCYRIRITDDSRVLRLDQPEKLVAFTVRYKAALYPGQSLRAEYCGIDWPRVAEEFAGIVITPYQWSCRMSLMWYYGFDCASGCVWEPDILQLKVERPHSPGSNSQTPVGGKT